MTRALRSSTFCMVFKHPAGAPFLYDSLKISGFRDCQAMNRRAIHPLFPATGGVSRRMQTNGLTGVPADEPGNDKDADRRRQDKPATGGLNGSRREGGSGQRHQQSSSIAQTPAMPAACAGWRRVS